MRQRRVFAILSLMVAGWLVVSVLGGCTEALPESGQYLDSIEIRGSGPFVEQTRAALHLLKDLAPDAYARTQTYVAVIQQAEHSGMVAYAAEPTFEVNEETAGYSTTWYAGAIAHDATHSMLYHDHAATKGVPVPDDVWTGQAAERFCIEYQLDVIRRIDAPSNEITWLMGQDGSHCDTDGDGDCDWQDRAKVTW